MYRFLFFIPFVLNAVNADAQAEHWSAIDDGCNNSVQFLYTDTVDNLLYIGGKFTVAGTDTVNGIAVWDGQQYYSLGTGQDNCASFSCANPVRDIIRYKDEVYCGVRMPLIDGIEPNGIARWNGTNWNLVGNGVHYFNGNRAVISDLVVWQDDLYVSGIFQIAGQDTAHSVARWDGVQWYSVGFPIDEVSEFSINLTSDIFVFNDELYVSGNLQFDDGNGSSIWDILKFDGNEWGPVANGNLGGFSGEVRKMIEYQGELYIGGLIYEGDGNAGNGILKLEGDEWVDVGGSFDDPNAQVHDMIVYNDKLYVMGIFYSIGGIEVNSIASWDGQEWSALDNNYFDNRILASAIYNNELIIGGGFSYIDSLYFGRLAKWGCSDFTDSCEEITVNTDNLINDNHFKIYPNPVQSNLIIELGGNSTYAEIRIFNTLGEEVYFNNNIENNFTINTNFLVTGVYWIQLNNNFGNFISTKTFIKI